MHARERRQTIAVLIVALIVAIITWYVTNPRTVYAKLVDLVGITYTPPGTAAGSTQALVFTFSNPIGANSSTLAGMSAVLKSFIPDGDTTATGGSLVSSLIDSGVPFVPTATTLPTQIATNTLPNTVTPTKFPDVITVTGAGAIWMTPIPPSS